MATQTLSLPCGEGSSPPFDSVGWVVVFVVLPPYVSVALVVSVLILSKKKMTCNIGWS